MTAYHLAELMPDLPSEKGTPRRAPTAEEQKELIKILLAAEAEVSDLSANSQTVCELTYYAGGSAEGRLSLLQSPEVRQLFRSLNDRTELFESLAGRCRSLLEVRGAD